VFAKSGRGGAFNAETDSEPDGEGAEVLGAVAVVFGTCPALALFGAGVFAKPGRGGAFNAETDSESDGEGAAVPSAIVGTERVLFAGTVAAGVLNAMARDCGRIGPSTGLP
jgi:hypothetical protein